MGEAFNFCYKIKYITQIILSKFLERFTTIPFPRCIIIHNFPAAWLQNLTMIYYPRTSHADLLMQPGKEEEEKSIDFDYY